MFTYTGITRLFDYDFDAQFLDSPFLVFVQGRNVGHYAVNGGDEEV